MKPGICMIIVGGVVFLFAVILVPFLAVVPVLTMGSKGDSKFLVPGGTTVTVEKAGRYYLWNEYRTLFDGKTYNRPEALPDGWEIEIRDRTTGEDLELTTGSGTSTTGGQTEKKSIGYVDFEEGDIDNEIAIEVKASSGGGGGGKKSQLKLRVFSFSRSEVWSIMGWILGGVAGSLVAGLIGVCVIILGVVKTVRAVASAKAENESSAGSRCQV